MWEIIEGDNLKVLLSMPDQSVNTCITSPPYWLLRDYGANGQLGLESLHDCSGWATGNKCGKCYVCNLTRVLSQVSRVLRDVGTLWLNLGDTYFGGGLKAGNKIAHPKGCKGLGHLGDTVTKRIPSGQRPKNLAGIPWRVALALQADGWYLRSDIIWHKPNAMPESVQDRPTKAHEYVFLLSKSHKYYYDNEIIREPVVGYQNPQARGFRRKQSRRSTPIPGQVAAMHRADREDPQETGLRNKRSVWSIRTKAYHGAHFAVFPPELVETCVLAGCPAGGMVLDPFAGSGTTLQVASEWGRKSIGIEVNADYVKLARERLGFIQMKLPI